jgi:hypothetical protein
VLCRNLDDFVFCREAFFIFLLIKPGTIHTHCNASTTVPLGFLEHVIVDQEQRSTIFME